MGTETLPTVNIVVPPSTDNPAGYVVINASDFDATTMKEHNPLPIQVVDAPAAEKPAKGKKIVAPWAK